MQTPSFDTWTIVFVIAAVQAVFTALVLFRWKRGNYLANRALGLLLLLFGYTLGEYVLYWTHYLYFWPHFADISSVLPLLFGPLLWWYFRVVLTGKPLRPKHIWHLLPLGLAILAMLPWFMMDSAGKQAFFRQEIPHPVSAPVLRVLTLGRIIHLLIYAVVILRLAYQQSEAIQIRKWALVVGAFFSGFVLAYTSYFILVHFSFFNIAWDYHISAAMTAFIYLIAYSGYTQEAVFQGFDWKEAGALAKYRNSGLTPDASLSILKSMQQLMATEHLYRIPELSLEALAGRLQTSRHHLSQVINEHTGMSFFEYLNQLRIHEARLLLETTDRTEMHIIEIAYSVGFNNKVSFNTAFRKSTGMTPSEYRKNHHRSDTNPPSAASA